MANNSDDKVFENTLKSLGTMYWAEREFDLYGGHYGNIQDFLDEYLSKHTDLKFVGAAHLAKGRSDCIIDPSHSHIWKNDATKDWKITPTGLDTEDEVFPETASKAVRLDEDPDHWAYQVGIIEIGSANNMVRMFWAKLNGDARAFQSLGHIARLGQLKFFKINPAIEYRMRGSFDIDMEFETTTETEIFPPGIHIFPQEIAVTEDLSDFCTDIAS